MPLIVKESSATFGNCLIWHRTEDEFFFLSPLELDRETIETIAKWNPIRRLEWLAGRYLIKRFLNTPFRDIHVDKYGKPHLSSSSMQISLSHSHKFNVISYGDNPLGVDYQLDRPGISRIAHKFCHPDERDILRSFFTKNQMEHIIWSAKEAVYKAYGRKSVRFRDEIFLHSPIYSNHILYMDAKLETARDQLSFKLRVRRFLEGTLAIAVQV